MNILLLTSHAIAEYDDLRMFTDLGYDVYSIGGAYDEVPFEGKRPALPNVTRFFDLEEATNRQRARLSEERGDPDQRPQGGGFFVDWGKADLAPEVVDWLDVVIIHHFPEEWLQFNWPKLQGKRVIWRTCGQSDPRLEANMAEYHGLGLEIVRYSPAEKRYFQPMGTWAGEDALIRFGKYVDDYGPWIGDDLVVGNITQNMAQRGDACGLSFWQAATDGLPVKPAGPASNMLPGGIGSLSYPQMLDYLRHIRAYLYTGTRPASYTLGLMEALLSGVPTVSIGAHAWGDSWNGSRLFEAATDQTLEGIQTGDIARPIVAWDMTFDDPSTARRQLQRLLEYPIGSISALTRKRAVDLFDVATIGRQWTDFLGAPTTVTTEKATAA